MHNCHWQSCNHLHTRSQRHNSNEKHHHLQHPSPTHPKSLPYPHIHAQNHRRKKKSHKTRDCLDGLNIPKYYRYDNMDNIIVHRSSCQGFVNGDLRWVLAPTFCVGKTLLPRILTELKQSETPEIRAPLRPAPSRRAGGMMCWQRISCFSFIKLFPLHWTSSAGGGADTKHPESQAGVERARADDTYWATALGVRPAARACIYPRRTDHEY